MFITGELCVDHSRALLSRRRGSIRGAMTGACFATDARFGTAFARLGAGFGACDGGYRTGDRARVDADGFVYVVGRTQTFVKTGSHRVAVEEIEEVLGCCPGVVAAAICGVPHRARGEALIAVVVLRPGHLLSPVELRAHCARSLPPFKIPIEFRSATALPMTASGKIDRVALAALVRGG